MLEYLRTYDLDKCCGCNTCAEICPKNAIFMQKNEEGFLYPVLDEKKCIHCGLCEAVCPEMSVPEIRKPRAIYAVQYKKDNELFRSSSGGAFRFLADKIISDGGYVVGCTWNKKMEPVLSIAGTTDELEAMQGSKYLSSNAGTIYTKVKKLLDGGYKVLFTGMPCQCAGMIKFLRKPYENLITMDFLCHGVPSQDIFDSFRKSCEKKYGNRTMEAYSFRDKEKHGWSHSESFQIENRKYYQHGLTSPYLYGFVKGYFNRYSCYSRLFRGEERFTDFTVCDFWGYERYYKKIDYRKGVSALQVNTEKAEQIFCEEKDKLIVHEVKRKEVAHENPDILECINLTIPYIRKSIYSDIEKNGWDKVEKKYLHCKHYTAKKIWYILPDGMTRKIKDILKKIQG